jgi:ABC-type transporter Mla subunit MlaD
MFEIDDAIEAAAGDRDGQISSDLTRLKRASRSTARARGTISRFLENVPDELTVFELKELLERRA